MKVLQIHPTAPQRHASFPGQTFDMDGLRQELRRSASTAKLTRWLIVAIVLQLLATVSLLCTTILKGACETCFR